MLVWKQTKTPILLSYMTILKTNLINKHSRRKLINFTRLNVYEVSLWKDPISVTGGSVKNPIIN